VEACPLSRQQRKSLSKKFVRNSWWSLIQDVCTKTGRPEGNETRRGLCSRWKLQVGRESIEGMAESSAGQAGSSEARSKSETIDN
jgi:hypothetical protein